MPTKRLSCPTFYNILLDVTSIVLAYHIKVVVEQINVLFRAFFKVILAIQRLWWSSACSKMVLVLTQRHWRRKWRETRDSDVTVTYFRPFQTTLVKWPPWLLWRPLQAKMRSLKDS